MKKPTIRRVTSEDSDQPAHLRYDQHLCLSHVPFTASRLFKEGYTRTLAILGRCTG